MSHPDSIPPFPFERYFPSSMHDKLPNYEHEWNIIIIKLVITSIFFLVVVPSFLKVAYAKNSTDDGVHAYHDSTSTNESVSPNVSIQKEEEEKKKKKERRSKNQTPPNNSTSTQARTPTPTQEGHVPTYILIMSNGFYILVMVAMVAFSPNNITTARRVYQAPLLKVEECQMIIEMANRAAARNAQRAQIELDSIRRSDNSNHENEGNDVAKLEKIISWPSGWKKDRHATYPTTDLNVVIDFERSDLDYLSNLLDARLGPLLSKIYGIPPNSIRANDMFVVRYDGYDVGSGNGQQSLKSHTDSSHISFNILLNDAFDGGGTRYYDRLMEGSEDGGGEYWYYDARPGVGDVLLNNAMVNHAGLATTKGTRYIFVGFMNIDRINPWTKSKTNAPFYSTYLSFPWITVVLKSHLYDGIGDGNDGDGGGSNRDNSLSHEQQVDIIITAITMTIFLGDYFAPHGLIKLIENDEGAGDNAVAMKYINALDKYYEKYGDSMEKANWFKGQMIYINLDGTISSAWPEREEQPEKFAEL